MEHIAFQLRLKHGMEEACDEAHRHVWPDLPAKLQCCGVRKHSIFRRGCELFRYMLVPNFDPMLAHMAYSDVDRRWQQAMAPMLERGHRFEKGRPLQ